MFAAPSVGNIANASGIKLTERSIRPQAAPIAGLSTTTTVAVSKDWSATKLVAPKSR